jgi:hypothetical protein
MRLNRLDGARDRNRTDTLLSEPGILSPVRMTVSPPGRIASSPFYIQCSGRLLKKKMPACFQTHSSRIPVGCDRERAEY